ncbi:MAG: hypothetical protein IPH22_10760 [Nitrosomonas sp.]|nr:hypothetical protein [Nitrosomonas sp.]
MLFWSYWKSVTLIWHQQNHRHFLCAETCPAYVSKNKLTNPDNTQILAIKYEVIEANKPGLVSWYRVILPRCHPKERWTSADRGDAQLSGGQGNRGNGNKG